MESWYTIKEQCAGKYRLLLLWWIYKIFHLTGLKIILYPIILVMLYFLKGGRKASRAYQQVLKQYAKKHSLNLKSPSTYRHIYSYAFSLAEKMSVLCDKKCRIKFTIHNDRHWRQFLQDLQKDSGLFLISSHLGNIETLAAIPNYFPSLPQKNVNALMEIGQNSIFHQFICERNRSSAFKLYDAKKLDFATIMELYEKLEQGDSILMAADRLSSQNPKAQITQTLLDKKCAIPTGTFQFAKKINAPTYAILLLRHKNGEYKLYLKQLDLSKSLPQIAAQYLTFIEKYLLQYPEQWYNFYQFFQ